MNLKKRASKGIALALIGITLGTPIFNTVSAMENNTTSISMDQGYEVSMQEENLVLERMTPDQLKIYNEAVDLEVQRNKGSKDFNESEFRELMNKAFSEKPASRRQKRAASKGIRFKNSHVAGVINVAISLATGGVGTAALSAYIRKVGVNKAIKIIQNKIYSKLISMGAYHLSGLSGVVASIVKNVLDPGSAIASWLDSQDKHPKNGYLDL